MTAKKIFIGLDAHSATLLDSMMADGVAPNLQKLASRSRRIKIENYTGMGDGVFWPSVATGTGPDHHGRYFMLQFDPETYRVTIRDEAKAAVLDGFWHEYADAGKNFAIIDLPRMPFKAVRNGVVLDNWIQHNPIGPLRSFPKSFAKSVVDRYGANKYAEREINITELETGEEFAEMIDFAQKRVRSKTAFCVDQLKEKDWDLFAVVFTEFHDTAHYSFHLHDQNHPRHSAQDACVSGDPVKTITKAFDQAVQDIIEAAPDAEVVLAMGPAISSLSSANTELDEIARRLDLGVGAPETTAEKTQKAYRSLIPNAVRFGLSPHLRRLFGAGANAAYKQRRFFAVPHNDNAGCIRINLKGRERFGTVEPGKEYRDLIDQISADMREIVDVETGESIVDDIAITQDLYDGPFTDIIPDLFFVWRREKPFFKISSPKIGTLEIKQPRRTGDHNPECEVWAPPELAGFFDQIPAPRPHHITELVRLDRA